MASLRQVTKSILKPSSCFSPCLSRLFTSTSQSIPAEQDPAPNTHFKITLRRSAIALAEKKKETLVSLGLHRRMQTVYHLHNPETAGKILKVKELVEVVNVPTHCVRTKTEQRQERKASRGYEVKGTRMVETPWEI